MMNRTKCPHCGAKLGNFRYADACPQCHAELQHNTKPLTPARKTDPHRTRPWLVRTFLKIVRLVES